jgi:hypothetical protein
MLELQTFHGLTARHPEEIASWQSSDLPIAVALLTPTARNMFRTL